MNASGVLVIVLLNIQVAHILGWQYFTEFGQLTMTGSAPEEMSSHSEYFFGDCKREGLVYYTTTHVTNIDLDQKPIIRGWIDVLRVPTCILLRAFSAPLDKFRASLFPFQMCVPRISYCHSGYQFKHYYFEWYIPVEEYTGGMDWDILFFGPPSLLWH